MLPIGSAPTKINQWEIKDRSGNQKIDRKVFHWENYKPDRWNYRKSEIAIPVHPRKRWSGKGYADDELHPVWRHGRTCSVCPSARCPASAMQSHGMVGNRRRDGTARAPRFKRKTVKSLSPTLGIAGESPQHSEDLQRKARPEGERPNNHPQKLLLSIPWKKEDRIFRSFALMIYICNWAKIIAENVDNYMLPT